MTTKTKAKKKLTALDFTGKDAAVALVSKDQGGACNGFSTLVMKAANFSDDILEKSSQIKVTMEITEFLTRMFGMLPSDSEILARAMGYTTAEMDDKAEDAAEGETGDEYEDYITSKVQSIEVMKQLYEADDISSIMSELQEEDYLALLQDQATIEKAFAVIDKQVKKNSNPVKPKVKLVKAGDDTPNHGVVADATNTEGKGVNSPVDKSKKKDKKMDETQVVTTEVEVIAKAQFDAVQKALDEQKVELQKALNLVAEMQKEKKEAIAKARKTELQAACGEHAEVLFKALGEADDAVFTEAVKALVAMNKAVENSSLFQEVGVTTTGEQVQESGVAAILKAKHKQQ